MHTYEIHIRSEGKGQWSRHSTYSDFAEASRVFTIYRGSEMREHMSKLGTSVRLVAVLDIIRPSVD